LASLNQDSQEDRRSDLIAGVQAAYGPPITFEMAGHEAVFSVDYLITDLNQKCA
jgi:hypothetical protein